MTIDYSKIWSQQGFTEAQLKEIVSIAEGVREVIVNPPPSTSNIREYCKKVSCWEEIKKQNLADGNALIGTLTIQKTEAKERKVEAKKQGKVDLELQFEMFLQELSMSGKVGEILTRSKKAALLTPNANSAFRKLQRGSMSLNYAEKDSLKRIFKELDISHSG